MDSPLIRSGCLFQRRLYEGAWSQVLRRLIRSSLLASLLLNSACLTAMIIPSAKSRHHHYTELAKIRSATLKERILITRIEMPAHGSEPRILSLPIRLDDPDWGFEKDRVGQLSCDRQRIEVARPPLIYAEEDDPPAEGSSVPLDRLSYRYVCDVFKNSDKLPEGIHAFALDPPTVKLKMWLGGSSGPPDTDHLPPVGASFVVIIKGKGANEIRGLFVDFLHTKITSRKGLYLLTPVTVAADAVTFPIQLIVFLICLASGCIQ